jgi:hypothetical protein
MVLEQMRSWYPNYTRNCRLLMKPYQTIKISPQYSALNTKYKIQLEY